jgi:hypothetical protein
MAGRKLEQGFNNRNTPTTLGPPIPNAFCLPALSSCVLESHKSYTIQLNSDWTLPVVFRLEIEVLRVPEAVLSSPVLLLVSLTPR